MQSVLLPLGEGRDEGRAVTGDLDFFVYQRTEQGLTKRDYYLAV